MTDPCPGALARTEADYISDKCCPADDTPWAIFSRADAFAKRLARNPIIDPSAPDAAEQIAHSQEFDAIEDEPTAPVPRPVQRPVQRPVAAAVPPSRDQGQGLPAGFEPEPDPAYQPVPRRRRRRPLVIVGLLIVALLIGLGTWWFGIGRYTVTPGVIDLPEASARAKVKDAGLKLDVVEEEFSETVANGAVIRTDPAPGERILKSGTLEAVLSKGPERHSVPKLQGLTEAQVPGALEEATLVLGSTTQEFHEKIPEGQVIRSTPKAGERVRRETAVDIVVSKGRKPIKIPDFTGKPAKNAITKLEDLGFKVDSSTEEFHDTVPKGRVISQSPSSGTGFKNDEIRLVVSKGPEMVTVPDVRRMDYEAARA
ncbi:MAG: PASTA domain-containing protein, partial [Myxococcales bacterium]